jgi:hypothetical protein
MKTTNAYMVLSTEGRRGCSMRGTSHADAAERAARWLRLSSGTFEVSAFSSGDRRTVTVANGKAR